MQLCSSCCTLCNCGGHSTSATVEDEWLQSLGKAHGMLKVGGCQVGAMSVCIKLGNQISLLQHQLSAFTGSKDEQSRRKCLLQTLLSESHKDSHWETIREHLSLVDAESVLKDVSALAFHAKSEKAAKEIGRRANGEKGAKSAGAVENIQKTAKRAIKGRNLNEEEDQWHE